MDLDPTDYPTAVTYIVLGLITAGSGLALIVYQTGATKQALSTRRGMLFGGVLLILMAGVVLVTQVLALIGNSYGGTGGS